MVRTLRKCKCFNAMGRICKAQFYSQNNMKKTRTRYVFYMAGYSTFWQDMNAKNYGVGQNRNRTIAVSILGNYDFVFPEPYPLTKVMKDYLEPYVEDKYYLQSEKARDLIEKLIIGGKLSNEFEKFKNDKANYMPFDGAISYPLHSQDFTRTGFQAISPTLSARDYKDPKIVIEKQKVESLGNIYKENWGTGLPGNVWNKDKLCPTLTTMQGGGQRTNDYRDKKDRVPG